MAVQKALRQKSTKRTDKASPYPQKSPGIYRGFFILISILLIVAKELLTSGWQND